MTSRLIDSGQRGGGGEADWLQGFFRPCNVAMIGASERSAWSSMVSRRFVTYEHAGKVFAVNPSATPAHGLPAFASCRDIPEPVDMAFVMVRAEQVASALEDAASAGIRNAVILSSGFAETGEAGAALQRELVDRCGELGIRMLGPNSLGFANLHDHLVATSIPARLPLSIGNLGVVAQSGSIAADISRMCHQQNIGMSFLCAPGNAAMIDILDVIEFMIGDPATKVILVYAESAFDGDRFRTLATRALRARKPIVVYKVGRSDLSGAVAQAHTGSVVGNDRIFDAVCRQYGVLRVNSVEELVTTGGVIGASGPLAPGKGVAFISLSGGAAAMFADFAEENAIPLPAFAPDTVAALKAAVPPFASVSNPFDITGGALAQPDMWTRVIPAILDDPSIGLAFALSGVPATEDEALSLRAGYEKIGEGYRLAGRDALIVGQMLQPVGPFTQQFMADTGCRYLFSGLELFARALGHLDRWSRAIAEKGAGRALERAGEACAEMPVGESAALAFLAKHGVPVVPQVLAASEAEAIAAAKAMDGPVAMKVASPDIAHKSEVGGVMLELQGEQKVAAAYRVLLDNAARACPEARLDGVTVAPMRKGGIELFVGIARDPQSGLACAVGLGGFWIEALDDTALVLLPASKADVVAALRSLRGAKMLEGYRGMPAADLDAVAEAVVRIGNAAQALGGDLAALEVNPLYVAGSRIEALDALALFDGVSR